MNPRPDARLPGKCAAQRRDQAFLSEEDRLYPPPQPGWLLPRGEAASWKVPPGPLRPTWDGRRKRTHRVLAPNLRNTFPTAPSPHAAPRTAEGGERSPRRGGRQTATLPQGGGQLRGAPRRPQGGGSSAPCLGARWGG